MEKKSQKPVTNHIDHKCSLVQGSNPLGKMLWSLEYEFENADSISGLPKIFIVSDPANLSFFALQIFWVTLKL